MMLKKSIGDSDSAVDEFLQTPAYKTSAATLAFTCESSACFKLNTVTHCGFVLQRKLNSVCCTSQHSLINNLLGKVMHRSIAHPIRLDPSFDERWGAVDLGLITHWERGREKSIEDPRLARQSLAGQLMVLPWKGGVDKAIQKKLKYGVFNYLAMWQGLRGEDLVINVEKDLPVTCTVTGMVVVFTGDLAKCTD